MSGAVLLGLLSGLNIAVVGMGIVLIFKAGKYINFAQAQLGVVPMLLMGKVMLTWGWSWYVAFPAALVFGAALGALCELAVVRPLSKLGPQPVLVGTLGIAQVLLGLAYVKQLSANQVDLIALGYPVPFDTRFEVGGATLFAQHVLTIIMVPLAAVLLWLFLSRTLTGKSIRAVACNEPAGRLAGLNINRLSVIAWAIAGALATIGAVLAAPNSPGFDPAAVGPALMFTALGAAALAGFNSFIEVIGAAALIGIVQAVVVYQTSDTSKGTLAAFILILVGLILRRNAAGLREATSMVRGALLRPGMSPAFRSTTPGRSGAMIFPIVLIAIAVIAVLLERDNSVTLFRIDQTVVICGVVASVSLLAGLTGQMHFGQMAVVGLGAAITAKLISAGSSSLIVNMAVAAAICAAVAILIALPSANGGTLMAAVTTLGFGVLASTWLFSQTWLNPAGAGYFGGQTVTPQSLPFIGSVDTSLGVAFMLIGGIAVLMWVAARFQHALPGRKMSAVRFSDIGARSIGLNAIALRLGAVALVGAMAGAAGTLDVSGQEAFAPVFYNPQLSLVILSIAVIGGLGSVTGATVATVLIYGIPLFLADWIESWGGNPVQIQLFLGGAGLVVNLLVNPGGLASVGAATYERFFRKTRLPVVPATATTSLAAAASRTPTHRPATVETIDVTRSFGAVQALSDVSVEVGTHEIVGLIGNNGAGKTTLLNCIAGDLRHHGRVEILGHDPRRSTTAARARSGLGRTFQDARLFAGLTTTEVLEIAASKRVALDGRPKPDEGARERANAIIVDLQLEPYAQTLTADLPTGIRRIVELGLQLAREPAVLLLDEPAAGLSHAEVDRFGPRLRGIVDRLGCSVLMIEHDLPLMLSIADRIYCLELGRIIAEGTPAEIRANPLVIESYFGSPDGVGANRSGRVVTSPDTTHPQQPTQTAETMHAQ